MKTVDLEDLLAAARDHVPGVHWRIYEDQVQGVVYGTQMLLTPGEHNKVYVQVASKRQVAYGADDAGARLRTALTQRKEAIENALTFTR